MMRALYVHHPKPSMNALSRPNSRSDRPRSRCGSGGGATTSLLVRLWKEGRRLHGDALRVYCENYPVYDWASAGADWQVEAFPDDFGHYGDVLGWRPLRDRLADRDADALGLPFLTAEHVAVTAGATQ